MDYIYSMYRVDKFYGPDRQVLANISLSFLPGAKIGVLGPNGAGKSTLLRIMAGLDKHVLRRVAEPHPGATVGLLSQEPRADASRRTCVGTSRTASALSRDLLDRFNDDLGEVRRADRTPSWSAARRAGASCRTQIDATDAWEPRPHRSTIAMDALRLPARRRRTSPRSPAANAGASRSAGCCCSARPAASRRAHQPPRRRVGRLARAPPARSTRAPSSRSPTTATSSTTSRTGFSSSTAAAASRTRATTRRGSSRSRRGSQARRSRRVGAPAARSSASSSGCGASPAARQAKSKARLAAYERAARRGAENVKLDDGGDPHPAGPAPGRRRRRGRGADARATATGC